MLDSHITRKGIVHVDGKRYLTRNSIHRQATPDLLQYEDVVDISTGQVSRVDLHVPAKRGYLAYHKRKIVLPRDEPTADRFDVVTFR